MSKAVVCIKNVYPEIDGGEYPVKRTSGSVFQVHARVSGAGINTVWVLIRKCKEWNQPWSKIQMYKKDPVMWEGSLSLKETGVYEYTCEVSLKGSGKSVEYGKNLRLIVEPERAVYASWYEMFHRSQGKIPGKSATFKDMIGRLGDINKMGFNVIYLPPIHPIGRTKRKGPNNSLNARPSDPGCPWSIGNELGGHKSVNSELGTLTEFRDFVEHARKIGIDIALDIALNCSPDHEYLKKHPGWFFKRPDGSIAYAENPPKKYEDVYPLNFYPDDKDAMWSEMKDIFFFWIKNGVKIFRVDNPHTKPVAFWKWLIMEVKEAYPETIFLAEAFTNYDKLEELAKIGFSQSYSYFTWRNTKDELIEYFMKLTGSYLKEFLKVNLFTNTPDICPPILQTGGNPAFKMRLFLAATLSSVYGIYNGYELCEANAFPGTEIYRDSEKYQYKVWDWDRPGNIKGYIECINRIRRDNPALHLYDNLKFCNSTNEHILCYMKMTEERDNILFFVVNLNPFEVQDSRITIPVQEMGLSSDAIYIMKELISGKIYEFTGMENYIRLDPRIEPGYIFRFERSGSIKHLKKKADKNSIALAREHGERFFILIDSVLKNNDMAANAELESLYKDKILPRVYFGSSFDQAYSEEINGMSLSRGFKSIIRARISLPGH